MTEFFVGDKVRVTLPHGYSKRGILGISVLYTTSPEARFEGATGRVTQINPIGPYSVAQFLVNFRGFDNGRLGIPWQAQWFREEWLSLVERGSLEEPPPTAPGPRTGGAEDSAGPLGMEASPGSDDRTPRPADQERTRISSSSGGGSARAEPPPTGAVGSDRVTVAEPSAVASASLTTPLADAAPDQTEPAAESATPDEPATTPAIAESDRTADDERFLDVAPTAEPLAHVSTAEEQLFTESGAFDGARPAAIGGDRVGRGAGLLGSLPDEVFADANSDATDGTDDLAVTDVDVLADEGEAAADSAPDETSDTIDEPATNAEATTDTGLRVLSSGRGWIRIQGSRACPDAYPIKGNAKSKVFHRPIDDSYLPTVPEICFESDEAAIAAGYRPRGGTGRPQAGGKKDQRKQRR